MTDKRKSYSLGVLIRTAMELISRSPWAFALLTVTLMANEHAMERLRWLYPASAWFVDGLCIVLWPTYFVLTALIARHAHFGLAGLRLQPTNIGKAMRYLTAPMTPIMLALIPAYVYGIPALNPLVGVAFALLASSLMWGFTPLSMLFHGLSPERAFAHTRHLSATNAGLDLSTILWLVSAVCIAMFVVERSQWASFLGPATFVLVVTSVYSAYTLTAEMRSSDHDRGVFAQQ